MISQVWKLLASISQKNWVAVPQLHSCCFFFFWNLVVWNGLLRSCKNCTKSFHKPFSQIPTIILFVTRVHSQNQETDIGNNTTNSGVDLIWTFTSFYMHSCLYVFYMYLRVLYKMYKILSHVDLCNHLCNQNAELFHHHKEPLCFTLY